MRREPGGARARSPPRGPGARRREASAGARRRPPRSRHFDVTLPCPVNAVHVHDDPARFCGCARVPLRAPSYDGPQRRGEGGRRRARGAPARAEGIATWPCHRRRPSRPRSRDCSSRRARAPRLGARQPRGRRPHGPAWLATTRSGGPPPASTGAGAPRRTSAASSARIRVKRLARSPRRPGSSARAPPPSRCSRAATGRGPRERA